MTSALNLRARTDPRERGAEALLWEVGSSVAIYRMGADGSSSGNANPENQSEPLLLRLRFAPMGDRGCYSIGSTAMAGSPRSLRPGR